MQSAIVHYQKRAGTEFGSVVSWQVESHFLNSGVLSYCKRVNNVFEPTCYNTFSDLRVYMVPPDPAAALGRIIIHCEMIGCIRPAHVPPIPIEQNHDHDDGWLDDGWLTQQLRTELN